MFFTIVLIPIKLALAFFLFKYRNTEKDEKYTVALGFTSIVLSANKTNNPISNKLANTAVLSN